ncbi:hypothetical protein O7608_14185 [Solwaraspora sp. WMMA2056]|uniref:hypothetical protein n=1 Tax=Solwaraspora sp. WMMA2056 TaxID=3015161 RepID=UPI00259BD79E|nr:hypothetical protein [Solwaraspora sp. WMMA2056]WJK43444.1 hypothetical protein O7608_14185 [Solwaraspora sp. WMMA2056]
MRTGRCRLRRGELGGWRGRADLSALGRCQTDHLDRTVQPKRSGGVRNQQGVSLPYRQVVPLTGDAALAGHRPTAIRDIYVFGGAVRTLTLATIGPVSFRANGGAELDIRCDLALIGVGAVDADAGFTTSNLAEAAMMQEMISRAGRVAILADSSKFGRRLFAQVCELGSADYLITDSAPPAELRDALAANDVKVITPTTSPRQRAVRSAV